MTPSLIWLDDVIRYCWAANAPEVTASTATSTAIRVIPFFKIVPLLSPGPHSDEAGAAFGLGSSRCSREDDGSPAPAEPP